MWPKICYFQIPGLSRITVALLVLALFSTSQFWFHFHSITTLDTRSQRSSKYQVGSAYKMLQLGGWKLKVALCNCASNIWLHDFKVEFGRVHNSGRWRHSGLWAAASLGSLPRSGNFFMLEITYSISMCMVKTNLMHNINLSTFYT